MDLKPPLELKLLAGDGEVNRVTLAPAGIFSGVKLGSPREGM